MKATARRRRRRVIQHEGPDPIDVYVGNRVCERRREKGITQAALAKSLGVTFQPVQQYETAESRISASRLYRLCQVLDVTPSYFFAGYPGSCPVEWCRSGG